MKLYMKYCNMLENEDIKKKTIESLIRSKETGKEHGFNFCSENGKAVATYVEGGEKDSVRINNICPRGARIMGALHVHTRPSLSKDAIPSPSDINKSILENMDFFCIGTNIENQGIIRCFDKKDLKSEIDKLEKTEDIDKSARLLVGRMTIYKEYLDLHSCQKIFAE